jgi:hypothetical protein
MKNLKVLWVLTLLIWAWILLTWCKSSVVEEGSQVRLSYEISDPETWEFISAWEKTVTLDYSWTALFQLLEGAKVWEERAWELIDPFNEHNPSLEYQLTTLVLNEMWIPAEIWQEVKIWDENSIITDIVSKDWVEQAILDQNPQETYKSFLWTFEVDSIR